MKKVFLFGLLLTYSHGYCFYIECMPTVQQLLNQFNQGANSDFKQMKQKREELQKNYQEYKNTLDNEITLQKKLIKLKINNVKNLNSILQNRENSEKIQ